MTISGFLSFIFLMTSALAFFLASLSVVYSFSSFARLRLLDSDSNLLGRWDDDDSDATIARSLRASFSSLSSIHSSL
jgi:hypothetical protein